LCLRTALNGRLNDRKFVAAEASNSIDFAHALTQTLRGDLQKSVTRRMAESVRL
jgi:hypothetical protein